MKYGHRVASLAILGVLGFGLIGCEKEATPTVPANPPAPAPQAAAPAAEQTTATVNAAVGNANTMAATATTEAQKLLDQAMENIKDKKWDLADETLKKLEGMKASLPADWAPKIDQARKAFDTAKAMPAMPAMPGIPK